MSPRDQVILRVGARIPGQPRPAQRRQLQIPAAPTAGDIGDNPREYEFEPLTAPATEPITVPATPAPAPAEPEKVPA